MSSKDEQPDTADANDTGTADTNDTAPSTPEAVADDTIQLHRQPPAATAGETVDSTRRQPAGALGGLLGLAGCAAGIAALLGVAGLYLTRATPPDYATASDLRTVGESITALQTSMADLEKRLEALSGSDDAAADSRRQLERSLRDDVQALSRRVDGFESVPPRIGQLENAVAAIQGIEAGARDTLLLAEAEHYLRLANSLLQLAGDAPLAGIALAAANERLTAIGNPALDAVRQSITDAMTALEMSAAPDIESSAMQLSSLDRLVASLPLKPADRKRTADKAARTPPGAASRAWNAVKAAVGGAVKITPPGGEAAGPLLPGRERLIRASLSLHLQAARLALLQGEQTLFEQSLDDAAAYLERYFDGASAPVQSARTRLTEVRAHGVRGEVPDISGPLRLLRRYRSLEPAG